MKKRYSKLKAVHEDRYRNNSEHSLTLDYVYERILRFMEQDPARMYRLFIGTDAQVHRGYTKFVTSITIHRLGYGAWFCFRQVIVPREITSIQEKLTLETTYSQEVACYFDEQKRALLDDVVMPYVYHGAGLQIYVDIDEGTDAVMNRTSAYVADMVGRVQAMGLSVRVKPEAVGASAVSNRMTKVPFRQSVHEVN